MNKRDFYVFPKEGAETLCQFYNVTNRDLGRCTPRQRAYIYGLMDKADVDFDEICEHFGFDYEEVKEIKSSEATDVIDYCLARIE